jgi:F-type H+-transporting ATPase subunit b
VIAFVPTILAEATQPEGIAALGIDPWAILAQAVTFLVLFLLIKKFALGKIVATLETRRKTIDKGVLLGIEMEKEKTHLDEEVEKLLQQARAEADKIIAGGQTEAGEIIKQAEEDAKRKADALLATAHNQISEDIERAKHELKKEMVDLVAVATGAVIREKVDAKRDGNLITKIMEAVR